MAYSDEQKLDFAARLDNVRAGLKQRGIRYYVEAAKALTSDVSPKQLQNVMQGQVHNYEALALLERIAGIAEPETSAA